MGTNPVDVLAQSLQQAKAAYHQATAAYIHACLEEYHVEMAKAPTGTAHEETLQKRLTNPVPLGPCETNCANQCKNIVDPLARQGCIDQCIANNCT